jgi:LmbE family N-acetylglucosaminyl deacetylase
MVFFWGSEYNGRIAYCVFKKNPSDTDFPYFRNTQYASPPSPEEKMPPSRILCVYAHPDDETFCAGGTCAKYAAAGAEIMVYSATRGEAGQIRDAHAATRKTLGQARAAELGRACRELGIQHVICADYGDGKLKDIPRRVLVEQVVHLIRSFRPDSVITFGDDGAYGHPDHIAIGAATDEAFHLAGDANQFRDQIASGLQPHRPVRLFHSVFPRNRGLLLDHLVRWLKSLDRRFFGSLEYINGLLFFADETTSLGYSSDHVETRWYPPGFHIVEQGEPATSLYMILSGNVDVHQEASDGSSVKVNELSTGAFFGEEGIATCQPRNAHVIAREGTTCLVFSPGAPTAYAGRGEEAGFAVEECQPASIHIPASHCIDVSAQIRQKIAAVAAYRTQYPITPEMFPLDMLIDLMGREYFMRVDPPMEKMATLE